MDSKRVAALGALAFALGACQNTVILEPMYSGPAGVAVLNPEQGGPFTQPVGFVSNSRSGLIHALDLKHGWVLVDDPAAPFLWGAALATGADRLLGELAVYSPTTDRVTLFVADAAYEVLVEVPYVVGVDESGAPVEPTPELIEASFVDGDDSGDSAELLNVALSKQSATEQWTLEYSGGEWTVTGSRSGRQERAARFLTPYTTDDGALSFTLSGTATDGDQILLSVDTGALEYDLGGLIQSLYMLPDQSLLLASVYERETEETALVAFDPSGGVVRGRVPLPEGAVPWRMSADTSGDLLYVADAHSPAVYEVLLDRAEPAASAVRTIETAGPVADVAWQGDASDSADGLGSYEHLFVAVAGANEVDLYDLRADGWKDINPYTAAIDGIRVDAPVTGMAATTEPSPLPERGPGGGPLEDRVVAISTFDGQLLLVEASTGCVAQDEVGPYSVLNPDGAFSGQGATSSPWLEYSESDGQYIRVNPCGGIARSEDWTATFDEARGGWVVEGVLSGEQAALAREDERYVSDDGAISFLIIAGVNPSTDGDQFRWSTVEGIARIIGDRNGDGQVDEVLELPARPAPYSYLAGPTGGGWDVVNRKTGFLWPITNSDRVISVDVEGAAIEYIWF